MAGPEHLEAFQWKKGQSGNPSGAKKGLAKASREIVGEDGGKLAEFWWSIVQDTSRRDSDRLEASRLLAERGWGKSVAFTAQEGDPLGLSDIEDAAEQFRRSVIRLADPAVEGPVTGGGVSSEPAQS